MAILSILLIFGVSTTVFAQDFDRSRLGDVNGDNKVTTSDARLILRYSLRLENLEEEYVQYGDIDGDGKVTVTDARIALRLAIRLEKQDCIVNGHDLETIVVTCSCETDGYTVKKCKNCNFETEKTNIIEARGHVFTEFVSVTAPTCTDEEKTIYKCVVCDATEFVPTSPSLGHDMKFIKKVSLGCVGGGHDEYKCSRCGLVENRNISTNSRHSYVEVSAEWKVIIPGDGKTTNNIMEWARTLKCTKCGKVINTHGELRIASAPLRSREAQKIYDKYSLPRMYMFEGFDVTGQTIVIYSVGDGYDLEGRHYNEFGELEGIHDFCGKTIGIGENMCNGMCNFTLG